MKPKTTASHPPGEVLPLPPDAASLAMLHQVFTHTLGLAMYNAVNAQQQAQIQFTAGTTAACARILAARTSGRPVPAPPVPEAAAGSPAA